MKTRKEPQHVKESRRLLADCGLFWTNVIDLYRIQRDNPDLDDICQDIIDWIMNR